MEMERKEIQGRLANIYEQIAGSNDYQRNKRSLRLIQICVITVSALATGFVNAFAHKERVGWLGAALLALLICGFVEKFYFTLRHGLTTVYKAGKQRFWAQLCYRTIKATMILNSAVLCAWIVGASLPVALQHWFNWSIAVHFALALVGVSLVRDSDAVVANRMLELKAATARQDLVTLRKAAAIGNSIVLLSAKIRGLVDALGLAWQLLWNKSGFAGDYLKQIDRIADEQFAFVDKDVFVPLPELLPEHTGPKV
jgi:hypothetical protein